METLKITELVHEDIRRATGLDDPELRKSPERVEWEARQRRFIRLYAQLSGYFDELFFRTLPKPAVKFEDSCWPPNPPACGCTGIFHTCSTIT